MSALIKTNNRNEKGTLYIALVEVTSRGGGLYDVVQFFKRTGSDNAALNWFEKLERDARRGKWNIHNTGKIPGIWDFITRNYILISAATAGQDTLEIGFHKRNPTVKDWVEFDEKGGCTYKKQVSCTSEIVPDILITGGWDPALTCNPKGGVCNLSWNCGTRNNPEDCETKISYRDVPVIFHIHPEPGTVSRQSFYIWNLPQGWGWLVKPE